MSNELTSLEAASASFKEATRLFHVAAEEVRARLDRAQHFHRKTQLAYDELVRASTEHEIATRAKERLELRLFEAVQAKDIAVGQRNQARDELVQASFSCNLAWLKQAAIQHADREASAEESLRGANAQARKALQAELAEASAHVAECWQIRLAKRAAWDEASAAEKKATDGNGQTVVDKEAAEQKKNEAHAALSKAAIAYANSVRQSC